jgi:hypothetical protein
MLNRCVKLALRNWSSAVLEIRRERKEEQRNRTIMKKIIQRLQNRTASFALDLWRRYSVATLQEYAEEERNKKVISTIVARMLNKALFETFDRWGMNVSQLKRQQIVVERILKRMMYSKALAGLCLLPLVCCLLSIL